MKDIHAKIAESRKTGEIDPQRWARWRRHDPVVLVGQKRLQENLRSLKGVYIDCGFKDQYFLHYGARILHRKLEALDIPHRYEEFDDDHSNIDYRMDHSLPYLYAAVAGS